MPDLRNIGARPAEPGERCTCGRQAIVVYLGGAFGPTGYCGVADGGDRTGPCPFCGGPRHRELEGRCPRYRLRLDDTTGGAAPMWRGATPTGTQLEHLPLERFHRAVDQLQADTVPEGYWRKVIESRRAGPPDGPPARPTQESPDDHDQHRP